MKFCWSTLMVQNMEESLKFYEGVVGLKIARRFNAGPGTEIVFLGEGETEVELICNGQGKKTDVGQDISWGFEVSSLEETMALVQEKGYAIQGGPFQPNPHVRFFYVLDPNGMKIQFVQNM